MWKLVAKGFKPWEIDPDYDKDEHIIKHEDKMDLLRMDLFRHNAEQDANKKKKALGDMFDPKSLPTKW